MVDRLESFDAGSQVLDSTSKAGGEPVIEFLWYFGFECHWCGMTHCNHLIPPRCVRWAIVVFRTLADVA
jgi:hypothetical protein